MYDTIIIGGDLSSSVAALAASRSGQKTVLVREAGPDGEYGEGGYTFPVNSTPCFAMGPGQKALEILKSIHPSPDESPASDPMDPAFQVLLPGHRVDIFSRPEKLISEMVREFPHIEREIESFYQTVKKSSRLVERWIQEDVQEKVAPAKRTVRELCRLPDILGNCLSSLFGERETDGGGPSFRDVIDAQLALLSYMDLRDRPYPVSAGYLLSLPWQGVYFTPGGRTAWTDWLHKGIVRNGGEVLYGSSVIRLDTKPAMIVDLEGAEGPMTIRGTHLIVSAQWEKLHLLSGDKTRPRNLFRRFGSVLPTAFPFSLHMGVRESVLPERMSPLAVLVPERKDNGSDPVMKWIVLEASRPGELKWAPRGKRSVSASVFLTESPLKLTDEELKKISAGIIDSLDPFFPFLREGIEYINIEKSISCSRRSQEAANHKYGVRGGAFSGTTTLSPRTSIPRVFLTGAMLKAGLGLEGEILSGLEAARLAGRKGMPEIRTAPEDRPGDPPPQTEAET